MVHTSSPRGSELVRVVVCGKWCWECVLRALACRFCKTISKTVISIRIRLFDTCVILIFLICLWLPKFPGTITAWSLLNQNKWCLILLIMVIFMRHTRKSIMILLIWQYRQSGRVPASLAIVFIGFTIHTVVYNTYVRLSFHFFNKQYTLFQNQQYNKIK